MPTKRRYLLTVCVVIFLCCDHMLPRASASNPGDRIREFLNDIQQKRLTIEFDLLSPTFDPKSVGPLPPHAVDQLSTIATGCCGDEARKALANDLKSRAQRPSLAFKPDYCVVYVSQKRETQILWISSDPSNLQMRYFGSDGSFDACSATEGQPGDLRRQLSEIVSVKMLHPDTARESIVQLVVQIRTNKLPIQLMSIDPKQVENVFGQKRWPIVGKVPITTADENGRNDVCTAIGGALNEFSSQPRPSARSFTPRLAIGANVQGVKLLADADRLLRTAPKWERVLVDGLLPGSPGVLAQTFLALTAHQHLLLMSFECRIAELYVDQQFKGCCTLNNDWVLNLGNAQLGYQLSADQFLYNVLTAAGQRLQPPSASSAK